MGNTAHIHLIVGTDDFLTENAAERIIGDVVPADLRAGAVEVVDGNCPNAETQLKSIKDCSLSIFTPPFLDPVKVTWWRAVSFLPGGGKGGVVAEDVKKALEHFANELVKTPPAENQYLIITATKLLKTSIFAKLLSTIAQVVIHAEAKSARDKMGAMLELLPELAAAEGLSFKPGAGEAFLAKAGVETRRIVSELAKIRTYLGTESTQITQAVVDEVVSAGGEEPELWTFTDAVSRRDLRETFRLMARFEGENGAAILLATILEKLFREMIVVRDAVDRKCLTVNGWTKSMSAQDIDLFNEAGFGPATEKRSWILRNRVAAAKNWSLIELRTARGRILKLREKLVSGAADDLLKSELARILIKKG